MSNADYNDHWWGRWVKDGKDGLDGWNKSLNILDKLIQFPGNLNKFLFEILLIFINIINKIIILLYLIYKN